MFSASCLELLCFPVGAQRWWIDYSLRLQTGAAIVTRSASYVAEVLDRLAGFILTEKYLRDRVAHFCPGIWLYEILAHPYESTGEGHLVWRSKYGT